MANQTPRSEDGPNRRALLRGGLVVGGLAAAGIASPAVSGVAQASSYLAQEHWTYCNNCAGLFFGPSQNSSICPVGVAGQPIRHIGYNPSASYNYILDYSWSSPPSNVQQNWNWCWQCQGLFFGPFQSSSYCPAAHYGYSLQHQNVKNNNVDTYNYGLYHASAPPGYQGNWNFCDLCQGLWYSGSGDSSCPGNETPGGGPNGPHAPGAWNYFLSWIYA